MRTIFTIFLLFIFQIASFAQGRSDLKSNLKALSESKPDTNRILILHELGKYYLFKSGGYKTDLDHLRNAGGRSALRYTHIQSILKGYIATCSQRVSTLVTEVIFENLSRELKERLILPIDGYNNFRQERRKRFFACETIYALYFSKLPVLEVQKLDSYLMATDGYLGCCQINFVSGKTFKFNLKPPLLDIKNRMISILTESISRIEYTRDGFLEEIIKHSAFDSWS